MCFGLAVFKVFVLCGQRLASWCRCQVRSCRRPIILLIKWWWNLGKIGHRAIDFVNAILKYVADQKVDNAHPMLRILPQELCETESVIVKGVNQLAHRFDAAIKL